MQDAAEIRRQALVHKITCVTTLSAAFAILKSLKVKDKLAINCLQELHKTI
jgi:carbamoyl-phosphate synthase large subunit